jgi:hypothetical protein
MAGRTTSGHTLRRRRPRWRLQAEVALRVECVVRPPCTVRRRCAGRLQQRRRRRRRRRFFGRAVPQGIHQMPTGDIACGVACLLPSLWCGVTAVVRAAATAYARPRPPSASQLPPTTATTWATAVDRRHRRRWCVPTSRGGLARTEPPTAWNSLGWFQLVATLVQRARDCGGLIVGMTMTRRGVAGGADAPWNQRPVAAGRAASGAHATVSTWRRPCRRCSDGSQRQALGAPSWVTNCPRPSRAWA